MSPVYRAVIFDMDGTMIDNMRFHAEVWVELAKKLGYTITLETVERDFAGKKNDEILAELGARLSPDEVARIGDEKEASYRAAYGPSLSLMPGLAPFLDKLRAAGIPTAVATAAPRGNRDFVLDGLALRSSFAQVVGAEDVKRGKPFPDIFLRSAEALGVEPAACLVFEDAGNGVRAARAAGMDVAAVLTTTPAEQLREAGARWTIADYTNMPADLLRALGLA